MRHTKRILALLISLILFIATFACAKLERKEFKIPDNPQNVQSKVIAKNSRFTLEWNADVNCAILRDTQTDHVWSTTPYDAYTEGNTSMALNSILSIEYYDLTDSSMQSDKSYACVDEGAVSSELVENGIRVVYYFSVAEVTIPVYITLEDAGIRITIKAGEIEESGKTKLIAISMAPYLCSVKNVQDKSAYLFVPTGSGALMYTDDEPTKSARVYSGEVYGRDGARHVLDDVENEQAIRMPVFGAKTPDNNALFAIIDKGAESARIYTAAGSIRYGFSNVYASFLVRGYDEVEQIIGSMRYDAKALADKWSITTEYSVCYYPLLGDDADYSGMAKFYQRYLEKNGELKKSAVQQKAYQLEIVGGALTKRFFLGIPYQSVVSLTSFNEAMSIIEETGSATSVTPSVLLSGYGQSGADIGKIAGGYTFSRVLGSKKQLKKVEEFCKDNNIDLYTDFELFYYSHSSLGFSTLLDTAKTANRQSAAFYPIKVNIRLPNKEETKIRLLKRSLLPKALNKLIKWIGNDISGICLGSFGSVAYSDYSDESTFMKSGMAEQIKELINGIDKSKHLVSLRSSNSYAAGIVDSVTDTPLTNGNYVELDDTVPFYQIVFGEYTALYSAPINYATDRNEAVLRAVEFGVSPKYLVIKNHSKEVSTSKGEYFYAAEYGHLKDEIMSTVQKTNGYYEAIRGSSIKSHYILNDFVAKTVYENGVTVYVNYSETDFAADGYTIPANGFIYFENKA